MADTPEVASWFGDDIAFRGDSYQIDLAGLPMLGFMLRHVGAGSPPLHRLRLAANLIVTGGRNVELGMMSHCLTTARMAERLGLGDDVREPLQQMFARWDGKGIPGGVGGEDIALPMRLFHLADTVEVFHRADGTAAAVAVARSRSGRHYDPRVVDAFCAVSSQALGEQTADFDWHTLIADEPGLQQRLTEPQLDSALEAVADFTDLRSTARAGHSRGVAELAKAAARQFGLPEAEVVVVGRAGLLHDVGLHGVPATILDKPGRLNAAEFERMRLHSYFTERMLARPAALARLGAVAALTHERLDGSGYHRGLSGTAIPMSGRILAAACAYHAMTQARPHRPALTAKQATAELRADVRAGRLATDAVDSVLAAAGQHRGKRNAGPAGLTPREVEVLTLIARGGANRQVARALGITAKTAGTHIERIYTKIGVSSRSTATLFALQHGLLDTLEPIDL